MFRLFLSLLFATCATVAVAQDKKPAAVKVNEPTKLKDDADYAVQGEYSGEAENDGKKVKLGVQVVAQGDGKFLVVAYGGGLPGEGWDGKKPDRGGVAERKDGKVTITVPAQGNDVRGEITSSGLTIKSQTTTATLKKVERKSPTLGAKPPEGADVLFGKPGDVENWQGGKIVKLSDGEFLAASNPRSKKSYQSFTAHVEFRLAWMPTARGQGRSNSGVYVQDRYELQVLDSFGLTGENNECGGFYQQSKPKENMCLPPMVWQTYDIDFTAAEFDADKKKTKNAKVVVKHNGVLIQDYEFTKATPGGKFNAEVPEPGSVFFQDHGDPVVYQNVWVLGKK
ncbi:3-keto-disaccharide hydrolase [Limnoglobus roseus]|uniref:3-keto-alpha-glucoside-1,2-lyase/3-keto-2-hydroxy-glucal hydratase domain-containing protein n=1 Tax=Limnoglobus roseus TaxID=2598579 RepID=A0A5C1AQR6_9BACT|nr:DUF1080 domain-containing protein [Limnoglobus roseus]QEL20393.1 hypothetical protein PX52LOC_07486 [Limnoglobus roseus]